MGLGICERAGTVVAMTSLSIVSEALIGVALAILVGGAGWVLFAGLRARREAVEAFAANARLEAMLASAPALAMVVRGRRTGRVSRAACRLVGPCAGTALSR